MKSFTNSNSSDLWSLGLQSVHFFQAFTKFLRKCDIKTHQQVKSMQTPTLLSPKNTPPSWLIIKSNIQLSVEEDRCHENYLFILWTFKEIWLFFRRNSEKIIPLKNFKAKMSEFEHNIYGMCASQKIRIMWKKSICFIYGRISNFQLYLSCYIQLKCSRYFVDWS